MARPIKDGLSYYPLDVDMDYDDKVQIIEGLHGPIGFATIIKVLMKIYSQGYYYDWTDQERILSAKRIGVDINSLNNIINDCIKYGLFHEKLFQEFSILTSKGIQKRFFTAVGKRKKGTVYEEYLLIETLELGEMCPNMKIESVIPEITIQSDGVIQGKTGVILESSTQSKEKKSKEKDSKEEETKEEEKTENPPVVVADLESKNVFQIYQENFGMLSPIITDELTHWENDLSTDLVMEAMKRAALNQKNFSWAVGIMRNWAKKNITTMEQVKAEDVAFSNQQNKKRHYNNGAVNKVEKLPNWASEEQQTHDELLPDDIQEEFAERLRRFREGVVE